jgi:hypothetical protein
VDVITAEGLVKIYRSRRSEVRALDGVDLSVFLSLTGRATAPGDDAVEDAA